MQSKGIAQADEVGLVIAELLIMGSHFPRVDTATLSMEGRVEVIGAADSVRAALVALADIEKQKRAVKEQGEH